MKKILKKTLPFTKFENAIECIRIYLGIALFFKGIHFMIHPQDLVYFLNQGDLDVIEAFVSHYVISAHLIGGLMLGIGLLGNFFMMGLVDYFNFIFDQVAGVGQN